MVAMLARTIQVLLILFGLLSVLVAIFALRTAPATAASGFLQSLGNHLMILLYLFIGLLCFLGAYRLGKKQSSKSGQPPAQKG
jgi:uncharacterized membrane protein